MHIKYLTTISILTAAYFTALPANSQPSPADEEAELIGLHQRCDQGDRLACIRFGYILGSSREFQAEWRNAHSEWWAWESPLASGMPQVASNTPQVVNITVAPPELPIYAQPPIPAAGYIWTPGYWAYGTEGYFWVPGTWVQPPAVGVLWTPGYWGWRDGVYAWNAGYWGPHIGFYGGVNYGFGYGGVGFEGGRWNNGVFAYNETVTNFGGVRITNVYRQTVVENTTVRVSFNGGNGGTKARPTPQEETAAREQHVPPTAEQAHHQQIASSNKALLASENRGQPAIAATSKPGEFSGKGVVAARETASHNTPSGQPPSGTQTPEADRMGAQTPETAPTGARGAETNPTGARSTATTPTGAKTLDKNLNSAKTTETNPAGAKMPHPAAAKPETSEMNPNERKGPELEHAMSNGGTPPKPSNFEPKPPGPTPSATKPSLPQPHVAAAPPPHPAAPPRPVAKPGPPTKEKKPPG